jgi:hypothetical protein
MITNHFNIVGSQGITHHSDGRIEASRAKYGPDLNASFTNAVNPTVSPAVDHVNTVKPSGIDLG